jgi:outer membrane protein OmpA-like peptidoglycan-associated protein
MRWIVLIAISVALAACTQPSAPPPEPPPTRVFTVYFDASSADLTPTAQEIIGNVADALRRDQPSKIIVEGQARAGAPGDAELAVKRADTVVAALAKAGVDPNAMVRRTALVGPATADPITRVSTQKVLVEFLP